MVYIETQNTNREENKGGNTNSNSFPQARKTKSLQLIEKGETFVKEKKFTLSTKKEAGGCWRFLPH